MDIGDRIRYRREQLNLTQEELAHLIGYKSKTSINKIELNVQQLKQSKIKAIAKALQTTPAFILGWEGLDDREKLRDKLLEDLFNKIRKLSESHRSTIEIMVDAFLAEEAKEKEEGSAG